MVRLEVSAARQRPVAHQVDEFPCVVGRAVGCAVRVEAAGVWERHAEITLTTDAGFQIRALGEGSMRLNGEGVRSARVRNGDRVDLGGLSLRFWLSPVRARSHRTGDAIFWSLFAGMLTAMLVMLLLQPR